FTIAALGNFSSLAGTVNLTGTLDNTGTTLALSSTTGSWNLAGGTVKNGIYSNTAGAVLIFTSSAGPLDGVTADADLDLATNNGAFVHIKNGLTLNNATIHLGNVPGSTAGTLAFDNTETLGGTGTVILGRSGSNTIYSAYTANATLTIAPGITIRGAGGVLRD